MLIEKSTLEELLQARNKAALLKSEAQQAYSYFQYLLAKTLSESGVQIEDSALCLKCGTIRSASQQLCQSCNGG